MLESDPVRRFCLVCEDQTRQRSFDRVFTAVRQTLPPDQQRYIAHLTDTGFLRHEEGFELHKLFGGGEAPDVGKMAALMRRLDSTLPANLDASSRTSCAATPTSHNGSPSARSARCAG